MFYIQFFAPVDLDLDLIWPWYTNLA